ncbi:MAG: 3'-5' exonuclease [Verrucomicrobiota bacterium]
MLALEGTLSVIDFETTGSVHGHPNEPWQVGIVTIENGQINASNSFESYLRIKNRERPFHPQSPGRHHLLRDKLTTAPKMVEIWPKLSSYFKSHALVAHNVSTEKHILLQQFPMLKVSAWIDTLNLLRIAMPKLQSYALQDLIQRLDLTNKLQELCPNREAHDALYDSYACSLLLLHLLQQTGWQECSISYLTAASQKRN